MIRTFAKQLVFQNTRRLKYEETIPTGHVLPTSIPSQRLSELSST
jgi:hypothetical protein